MSSQVSEAAPAGGTPPPNIIRTSLQKLTDALAKRALSYQNELEEFKTMHDFSKKLFQICQWVKPFEENQLVLNDNLRAQLNTIKNYRAEVEAKIAGRNLPNAAKILETAGLLEERVKGIVAKIEKDNLNAAARKDIREDIDNALKVITDESSMQLNKVTRTMTTFFDQLKAACSSIK